MSSPLSVVPVERSLIQDGFSPTRSERARTLEITSPTPQINGHASGSNGLGYDDSNGINEDQYAGPSNGIHDPEPPKPERKRRKKGWKGWAMAVLDDNGNVIEITDGPEPDPLPSRRGRIGRDIVTSTAPSVEPRPTVVKKSKSPSPYIDGQMARDSTPPTMVVATLPKKSGGFWKQKKLPAPEPLGRSVQPERVTKRVRRYSYAASSISPAPSEPEPKTSKSHAPRHSLPKVKPPPKVARPGPNRTQPSRGDTQPSTARATPIITPDDQPTKPPRDEMPAKVMRTARLLDRSSPLGTDIRNEASMILASAAKHREDNPILSSPDDELTPASSTRLVRPRSPRTSGPQTRIRTNPADDSEPEQDFDQAFEKVKQAYRNGIRPCNNPHAPQKHSVPVYGLEDANPPQWLAEQPPTVVVAPRRDREVPPYPRGRSYREGLAGLTPELAFDAAGFVENVKTNLSHILTYYFPEPGPTRDAFVECIGRGLADVGWSLTDSGPAALAPGSLPPLPPPGPYNA